MLWESREEVMLVFPSSITIIHSFKKNVLMLSGNQSLCSVIDTGGNIHSCSQGQHHRQRKHHKKVEMGQLNLVDCDFSESSFYRMVKTDNRIKKRKLRLLAQSFFFSLKLLVVEEQNEVNSLVLLPACNLVPPALRVSSPCWSLSPVHSQQAEMIRKVDWLLL